MGNSDLNLINKLNVLPNSKEGHWEFAHKKIVEYLKELNISTMLEIGFNTGYSATMFLELLNLNKFYSIDIGIHNHVEPLYKKFKDIYKDKFDYLIENSLNIRNTYLNNINYDLIFIDGSHSFELALNDLLFCIEPIKTKYILLDDTGGASPGVTKLLTYIASKGYKLNKIIEWKIGAGAILYEIIH